MSDDSAATAMPEDELLTLNEAAAFLRMHPQTFRKWIKAHRDEIEPITFGRSFKFWKNDLIRVANSHKVS